MDQMFSLSLALVCKKKKYVQNLVGNITALSDFCLSLLEQPQAKSRSQDQKKIHGEDEFWDRICWRFYGSLLQWLHVFVTETFLAWFSLLTLTENKHANTSSFALGPQASAKQGNYIFALGGFYFCWQFLWKKDLCKMGTAKSLDFALCGNRMNFLNAECDPETKLSATRKA